MIEPVKIQVRFRDCDLLGHVNNAVYLSYFEQARMHYFEQLVGEDWNYNKQGILLVKNEIEYLKPILLNDSPEIFLYLEEIGTKSFTFSYEIIVDEEIRTKGLSKLVCFDPQKKKTVPVYSELRTAFNKLERK